LGALPEIEIVGAFTCAADLIALMDKAPADVIILDYMLGIGEKPTAELIGQLRSEYLATILVYSAVPGHLVKRTCLDQGAHGFIEKGEAVEALLEAVEGCCGLSGRRRRPARKGRVGGMQVSN